MTRKKAFKVKKSESFFPQAGEFLGELLHPDFEERLKAMFEHNKFNNNQQILFRHCLESQFGLKMTVSYLKSNIKNKIKKD